MAFKSINPATEEVIAEHPLHAEEEVESRLAKAELGFQHWRTRPPTERAAQLKGVANLMRERKAELAGTATREMGKPIAQSESEVDKCVWVLEHFADHAPSWLEPDMIDTEAASSYVRADPLGPLLAIMPWNFPYWQLFRFAAPAMAAGNVVLLKHAPNVGGCALAIESLFRDAGGEGLLHNLFVSHDLTPRLLGDERVVGVTLTGSAAAGRTVAELAGKNLKKSVLELGGSDAFIVLDDARIDEAAEAAVTSRTINSGQSCIAAKRFIVTTGAYAAFRDAVVDKMQRLSVGDPQDRQHRIGPLARPDLRDTLHRQVTESVGAGARQTLGGVVSEQGGYFYPATVLEDVRPGMAAFDQETFGPVLALSQAQDLDDAVALANRSSYGLGAALWTDDREQGHRVAGELEAGAIAVNSFVKSDPRLPFGGIKDSGYGRELGRTGLFEFVNLKSVWLD